MPNPEDQKKTTQGRGSGMRTGGGQGGRGDGILEKKARQLADDFAKDPFIEKDSAAADILKLRDTLKAMVSSESGEIKDAAQQLLDQTEQLITSAKKFGKVSVISASTQALTQQVHALAKQLGTIESTLGGYKVKYVQAYQKSLTSFEQAWTVRFSGLFPAQTQMQAQKQKAIPEKLKNVRSWDAYMNAFLGDKVEKGKEKESLAKAMSGLMLKQQNKPFSLEEADKLAANILKSEAFQKTFGKNGKLVEEYLKNRNISQAILLMDAQVDKAAVKKLQKEQDVKYKKFNEFLNLHPALKLGYEVMSKKDAEGGTSEVQKMIDEYHKAKQDGNEMTEARIMTKLLKEADPILQQHAGAKRTQPAGAEPAEPVLTHKPEAE
ncbi:MAG: hypothetical protein IKW92_08025 [Firmicutes bacterium]|nr:hypothetical protein [Bacillota bacterium]